MAINYSDLINLQNLGSVTQDGVEDVVLQVVSVQTLGVIVHRVGKLHSVTQSTIILEPHSLPSKDMPNIIGQYCIVPIDDIKEIIIL